jgi:hypothetical protein
MVKERKYRMIDGTQICSEPKRIGYCWCDLHQGFINKRLLDEHECISKGCQFFEKFNESEYWKRKAVLKQKRQEGKMLKKQIEIIGDSILNDFDEYAKDNNEFAALSVEYRDNKYIVRCASINTIPFADFKRNLSLKYGVKIELIFIQNTYNFRKQLIEDKKRRR